MKITGSLYKGKEGFYLALYSDRKDIFRKAPPCVREKSIHMGHITYSYHTGKTKKLENRSIDVYFLKENSKNLSGELKLQRTISSEKRLKRTDKKYGINYQIINAIKDSQKELDIIYNTRKDIMDFCSDKLENPGETNIIYPRKIIPKTILLRKLPMFYNKTGKQDHVPSCSLDSNIDPSRGCISGFIPGDNAKFDGETFTDFWLDFFSFCEYCYSGYKHGAFPNLLKIDKERLKEELTYGKFRQANWKTRGEKVDVLRFGKNTEPASIYTLDEIVLILETCLETKTKSVLTTKYLPFDKEIANLLKKTNSSLLYGITRHDELEKGVCIHGCNNAYRIEKLEQYKRVDVNAINYLHIDAIHPPEERDIKIIKSSKNKNIRIQLLPFRFYNKDIALKITGVPWEALRENRNLDQTTFFKDPFIEERGSCKHKGNSLTPVRIHQEWLNLIKKNNGLIRMCHHNDIETYCGSCFLKNKEGFITPTEEVDIDYKKKSRWGRKKKKGKSNLKIFK